MEEIGIDPCAANPGPIDPSVLYDQEKHVSSAVWDGQERGALRCHEHTSKLGEWRLTPKQIDLVEKAGFGYLRKIPAISLDNPLISALVERWRRETNTFHFTVGEMTVTLQDVAFLLGLAINGKPVIGITYTTCGTVCEKYLGKAPDSTYASGGMVKLSWLKEFFSQCPEDAPIEEIEYHTRAYLLYLVGSTIFSTTTGNKVPVMYLPLFENFEEAGRYAWGAAALAFLYRALGNASVKSQSTICGCLTLLQCWNYYHLNIGRPKLNRDPIHDHFPFVLRWKGKQSGPTTNRDVVFYRKALDSLEPCDVEWLPYKYMDSTVIPVEIRNTLALGRSKTMLICFDKAERHLPNRVLRQYGMLQLIPEDVAQWVRKSRGVDGGVDLSGKMESELSEWEDRALHIVKGDDDADENEYMVWYMRITRKVVGRPISLSSEFQRTIGGVREISYLADTFPLKGLQPEQFESISRIRAIAQECLRDQVGGQIVVSPIGGTDLGKRSRGKERVRRKVTGKRKRSNDPMEGHGVSEDESPYCGMVVEVDHLHLQHEDNDVHLLPFCTTVVEGENGLQLDEPNKVDEMQFRDTTDGIDASHFCDESNDVDDSNIPHAISEIDLQNTETAENVILQSSNLPNATNDTNGSEIHNTNKIPDDSQLCNATDGVNDPQTQVATDVNESETHHATENIGELEPSYVSIHSDQETVKAEAETVLQLPHENTEDLPQQGETSVVQ
ncbi:thymidine kinase-like [Hibiscus syriacus]|uniref:Thymidine kinase-like n=1 Tax=Hibiscus syriacus TaxID=106335 RepID=A0A6A2X913_HIBSY|nr:protein MAIN-LIKE 2-like [Hibiscus syriacus]XP_039054503.1 protein MAIN-LIKE 2-like [Hibiscus syriacus]XP_039054504.1 protein MAIN-LIKE 2-like [Hibiscus syriacus]XP_039054505.1 protein MAIN-LIKE 2-like [Hibiscus syriacus]KAE8654889.1 thymidine kinase-like [Hibiscus syriacus]